MPARRHVDLREAWRLPHKHDYPRQTPVFARPESPRVHPTNAFDICFHRARAEVVQRYVR